MGQPDAGIRFALAGHSIALGPPFATMRSLSELTSAVSAIRTGAGTDPATRFAAAFPTYVGEDPSIGLEALSRFLEQKHEDGTGHLEAAHRPAPLGLRAEELVRANLAIVGRPEEVRHQVAEIAATGITDLFMIPDFGGLSPDAVLGTLAHFAPGAEGAPGPGAVRVRSGAARAT